MTESLEPKEPRIVPLDPLYQPASKTMTAPSSDPNALKKAEEHNDQPDQPEKPPRDITGWRWISVMIAILSSIFLYALDATVVADIQSNIVAEFDALDKLSWLSSGILMAATAVVMPWGRVYGQFNAKHLYLLNVALFEAGSALCGAAPTIEALIVGRAICGVSGAGIYLGVMTLIASTTTMAERPLFVSGTGFTWGVGIVLGPVVGGAFSISSVGWRWAFYINLFIGLVCAPVYIFLIPSIDPRPGVSWRERAKEMDWVGMALMVCGLVAFFLAVNWGGVIYPWNSGSVIGAFVAAGVLFLLLGIQQVWTIATTLARRIIPVQLFGSRTVLILFACTAAGGASAFVPIYFLPLFFQFTQQDAALEAGVRLLPFIVVMVVIIFANGALMAKFGYYMPWFTLGGGLALAGAALMYTVRYDTSSARIYGYTVVMGAGVGMWLQAGFSVAQAVVSPENIPAAVGFITLSQFTGITMALAIANTVFLNDAQTAIEAILPDVPAAQIQSAVAGTTSGFVQSLAPDVMTQVLEAIVEAIDKAYILVMVAGALVVVLSLGMKRERVFVSSGVGGA